MLNRISPAVVIALSLLITSIPALAQGSGADTYKAKCQMCHGADGLGATPAGKSMKAIPFNDPQIVHKSDAELIEATTNGKGKMPAYKGKLTDAEIKEVIGYIRILQKK
jgi:mono/diheme cytochrome c family protein